MSTQMNEGFTVSDLDIQKFALEYRIIRLKVDLMASLEADLHGHSSQVSSHMLLSRLLEVERDNLSKVNFEIAKKIAG